MAGRLPCFCLPCDRTKAGSKPRLVFLGQVIYQKRECVPQLPQDQQPPSGYSLTTISNLEGEGLHLGLPGPCGPVRLPSQHTESPKCCPGLASKATNPTVHMCVCVWIHIHVYVYKSMYMSTCRNTCTCAHTRGSQISFSRYCSPLFLLFCLYLGRQPLSLNPEWTI